MSKDASKEKKGAPAGGGQVIELARGCLAEGCKSKTSRAGFCEEHFIWFKEGLVTKEGHKPKDFDKKYMTFMNRNRKVA